MARSKKHLTKEPLHDYTHPGLTKPGPPLLFDEEAGTDMLPQRKPRFRKGQRVWLIAEGPPAIQLVVREVLARGLYTLDHLPGDPNDSGEWVGIHEDELCSSEQEGTLESLILKQDLLVRELQTTREQVQALRAKGGARRAR